MTYLKLTFLDECENNDQMCDKCSEDSECDKEDFCFTLEVQKRCPKLCNIRCTLDEARYAFEK